MLSHRSFSLAASLFALFAVCGDAPARAEEADIRLLGLDMPQVVAGFPRGRITDFETDRPGMGYGVKYDRPGYFADVFIYDAGVWILPTNWDSRTFRQHFAAVAGDVKKREELAKKEGRTVRVRELEDTTVSDAFGAQRFYCRSFRIDEEPAQKDSMLCLTVWDDKFVKVRVTSSEPDAFERARAFVAEWAPLLWSDNDPAKADARRTRKYLGYVYMMRAGREVCGFEMSEAQQRTAASLMDSMRQRAHMSGQDAAALDVAIRKRAESKEAFCNPKGRFGLIYATLRDVMLGAPPAPAQ